VQSIVVNATDGANTGNDNQVTATGTGASTATLAMPGLNQGFVQITSTASCTGARQGSCQGSTVTTSTASNLAAQSIAAANLDSYVGSGNVSAIRTATLLSATQNSNQFTGTESTGYTVSWSGTLHTAYTYLLHAAPSFESGSQDLTLDLDFGTVSLGDAASLGFTIFNLSGIRAGLDLDSVTGSGDTAVLTTDLGLFSGLAAGDADGWTAYLDTTNLGLFAASYSLMFSDADIGAASSRASFYLTLNLFGEVTAQAAVIDPPMVTPTASVPEPGTLALLGVAGACLLAVQMRRGIPQRT
jgi:hypothetical protein